MVSGHDSEVRGPSAYSPSRSNKSSPCSSPTHPQSSSSGGNSLNSSPHSSNGFVSNGIQNGVSGDVETLMEIEEENEVEIARNGVLNGSASQEEITCSPRRGNAFLFHFSFTPFAYIQDVLTAELQRSQGYAGITREEGLQNGQTLRRFHKKSTT